MATILRNAAAAAANRGQPSSFYNKDKTNPVYLSLEQETKKFMGYMRKRNSPDYRKPDDESCSRAADTLFELWNKYEPKLPLQYYQEKLLSMGDFLLTVKEYSLALWQCYERYLLHFGNVNTDEITDVGTFKSCFFPDGFDGDDAGLTFRALMGKSISMYQVVKSGDPKLQNRQSVDKCVQILDFLRLVMQVVLPKEKLCWLVYNGTIHIYSISRHLMSLGHSARVVQYLLWASICMETSVPLLAVKYLPWRATLYTAVCQCYFDCKSSQHAEAFARRGLAKINELSHLEKMSNSTETNESESCFRQATVKMAVMIFRRSVFETRRKPKNQLRPKTRANLKDAANLPWPRTPTEKLLADMFDGSAAQFLCIMESLNDTNRRIILTSPPAPDSDVEILDVYAELFLAAQEILAGGGGNRGAGPKPVSNLHLPALAGVVQDKALLTLATKGDDGATIDGAIRLVKMAYCFEQWDVFDQLVETVLLYIRNVKGEQYAWDEKALELLQAMEKVNPSRRHKRVLMTIAEEDTTAGKEKEKESTANQDQAPSVVRSAHAGDDLVNVADVLMSIVNGQFHPSKIEVDMVVDTALFLWNKTKAVFQKHQTGSLDNPKYLQRMDNPNKWVYLLDVVHQVLCWCGLSSVDPALTAEVVLRLALVLESSANIDEDNPSGGKESKTSLSDYGNIGDGSQQYVSRASMLSTSMLNLNPRNQLMQAREILELGLQNVSYARQAVALTDGKSIADVSWAKLGEASEVQPAGDDQHRVEYDLQSNISFVTSMVSQEYNEVFTPEPEKDHEKDTEREVTKATIDTLHTIDERGTSKKEQKDHGKQQQEQVQGSATAVWNTIKDLHLELILIYHRVCLKLAAMGPDPSVNVPRPFQRQSTSKMGEGPIQGMYVESFKDLQARCNKNNLSKALLNMQQAMLIGSEGETTLEQKALMEEAVKAILKAQTEEKRIHLENNRDFPSIEEVSPTEVPPAPILLCRTDTMMVFKPAPFKPASGQTVSWYRIFARTSSGSNVKVRLNDYYLPGTGEEIPSHRCEMRISGLQPNEKYIFAVAAYTADGSLIGGSVGESSKPILASHPLPVLMTWGFLSQLAYQVGCYNIAHQACDTLWNHFIEAPPAPESLTYITESEKDFKLTLMKLNQRLVCQTSPVLLRQYLTSIFIGVDMSVREGELFCDVLCDKGPLYTGQMKRLLECEKMLVAVELAGWLNEANSALQAVVQCYGLLAPLIFYKIPSTAIVQILQRCHVVLLEIPAGLRQKRQQSIADSLHHMTACITYQMAKVLRSWGQKSLANNINESGRKLLTIDAAEEQPPAKKDGKSNKEGDAGVSAPEKVDMPIDAQEMETAPLALLKKKKLKKVGGFGSKDDGDGSYNEELKALEAHQLSLSKQAQYDHELTGSEDPSILHAYIAYLPSKLAYREVSKFKKRHRYLEFFVQVAQKALTEGMSVQVVEWCDETSSWLSRRNEQIIGMKPFLGKQTGAGVVTVSGDDPKRFHAAMVEYNKEKDMTVPRVSGTQSKTSPTKSTPRPKRKRQYKPLHVTPNMSDAAKQAQEEAELKAIEKMSAFFPDCFRQWMRKRRLRKVCIEELPWRCQLTLIQGLSHFSTFMQKLELKDKTTGISNSTVYKTSFLDPEWLTFETAGTLVVGWEGGPSRNSVTAQEKKRKALEYGEEDDPQPTLDRFDEQENRPKTTATGIEIAAALATGAPPPPLYMIPPEPADTPRTYRSEASYVPPPKPKQKATELAMINTKETMDILSKTFTFFRRSIVLAHRGKHWTLLHNSCRSLWNCIHTTLLRTFSSSAQSEDCLLSPDQLRELVWQPLHMATDCVLDMLTQLQTDLEARASKERKKNKKLGDLFESFMGEAVNEKGGASLKFENPLDNTSISDLRWVKRLVMRTIELLYYEQRWEKLVDIALRFSALSNDRYAEQIIPTLVLAQRQLEERIQMLGGDRPPQKHFQLLRSQLNGVITAKDYLTCQLYISRDEVVPTPIRPGATLDPLGHGAYTSDDGKKIVSVPLEIPNSLQSLREVFEKTKYTCHALQHSRKLLVLYMAGQQNNPGFDISLSRQVSRVDFLPNTAKPQPTMPPDISREEYTNLDDVQTSCLPRSQLGTVIEAYEKTIEMLLAKNQKGLVAQAMHELGNLQYHASNIRAAYRWWAESLDHVLNATDALHTWRDLFKDNEDISSTMLERCGLWGCVLGGVLASNIAQYILTSDLGLRLDCCFLSGYFFKALFRSSLPHPKTDRDYALYEVGEGCEVTNLVPGIDLLSEKFRADGRQMIAALRWVSEELARGKHNLFVLPLLTLYLYFTTFICRDLQRSVDGRILKVRVLTDMQLFHEALIVLLRLIHGERLPHIGDSSFRQVESKMTSLKFNTSKPITAACNLKVMEILLDKRLSSSLATLYGPHLTCHLSLVQAHFLVAVADTIPVIPVIEDSLLTEGGNMKQQTMSTGPGKGKGAKTSHSTSRHKTKSTTDNRREAEEDDEHSGQHPKRFSNSKKNLTLELIKGTYLGIADQMVTTIAEVIQENAEHDKHGLRGLPAAELELVVLCKLEQAAIAKQKHHAPLSARIVLSAIKVLKSSDLFKLKKTPVPPPREKSSPTERPPSLKGTSQGGRRFTYVDVKVASPENSQFEFQNFQSRSRLDARLWLTCRHALVQSLMMQVGGLGEVKTDPDNTVLQELADCRQYCAEGLSESEACGDVEMQAEFLMFGAFLNIMEGKSLEHTIGLVHDVTQLLQKIPKRSIPADQLYAMAIMFLTDLEASERDDETSLFTERTLDQYLVAQGIILKQMEELGERIEHCYPKDNKEQFSTPVSPIRNIYLPHVLRLAQVKLRIGHAMARNAAKYIRSGGTEYDHTSLWSDALGVLTTAKELCQASVGREANLEAEILLHSGKIQRMLVYQNKFQPRKAAETLIDAIKTTFSNEHDLGLMRQAYLEIALVYMYALGMVQLKENSSLELTADLGPDDTVSKTSSAKSKTKAKSDLASSPLPMSPQKRERGSQLSSRTASTQSEEVGDMDKYRKAVWVAIRSASAIAQAQRSRILLIGDVSVTSQPLSDKAQEEIPEFVALDLVSDYVLGERKKVYKNEIEEELAPLIEATEVKHIDTYDEQVQKAKTAAGSLSWIQFLGYQSILQRLSNTATISASSQKSNKKEEAEGAGELGPEFDLGFISHAQCDMSVNHDVIRSMLFSGVWSRRLTRIHVFLTQNLKVYSSDCVGIFPPQALMLPPLPPSSSELSLNAKYYSANNISPSDIDENIPLAVQSEPGKLCKPPGSVFSPFVPSDKFVVTPNEMELALQFYQPSLEECDPLKPEASGPDARVMMLFALYKKVGGSVCSGVQWISLSQLNDLHDRLAVLAQRSEISLQEKKKREPVAASPTPTGKGKKGQRIRALSPKVEKDEHLEDETMIIFPKPTNKEVNPMIVQHTQNLLRQCVDDVTTLLGISVESTTTDTALTQQEIPFEVNKKNILSLENLFDPALGFIAKNSDLSQWLIKMLTP